MGQVTLGGITANKYVLEKGYCDGPGCSPPMVVVKTYYNGKEYALEFYHVAEINGENQDILDSFQFIK